MKILVQLFAKFGIVGIINTMFSLCVYTALLYLNVYYIYASAIGYLSGILISYMLNTKFVFKNEFNWFKMLRFFLVYGISFVLNIAYMFLLVEFFGLHKLIAQIVAVGLNMVFNFVMSRFWVFNNEKNRLHN